MNKLQKILEIRESLSKGSPSIGSWMQIPNGSIAEIMGNSGYDWVAVDLEHGAISVNQLPDIFRALELGNTLPLVRLPDSSEKECKQALDAGAGGVIIPMVESAQQLSLARDACRWPPSGRRGVAFSRANLFGENFNSYNEEAQKPLLIAMIESVQAINNLNEILMVEGLDAIFIGPYDLSASMGLTGQFDNKKFQASIKDIKLKSDKANIPSGLHVVEPFRKKLDEALSDGFQFVAFSIDAVFLRESAILKK
ncbi:aldolase/citrate lyase family protein [Candidatus Thioglobus sp.]|nr:aldolase/citrate lyase family protein [Candidatus Thioglobus sp.]